jgi:hypothetical protein
MGWEKYCGGGGFGDWISQGELKKGPEGGGGGNPKKSLNFNPKDFMNKLC